MAGPDLAADARGSLDLAPAFVRAGAVEDGAGPGHGFASVAASAGGITINAVAVGSMLSFQHLLDGRTVAREVARRSWIDAVAPAADEGFQETLGQYGRHVLSISAAARELLARLRRELRDAFAEARRVTILLSGGLDSRLTAAVLAGLARRGHITDDLRAVTWGIPESRDRRYAQMVADHLNIPWIPFDLGPANLADNIRIAAEELGALVSPVHLHALDAIRALDWDSTDGVAVSSLGNGVGRGLYLNRHVSYARYPKPGDWLELMRPGLYAEVRDQIAEEYTILRRRLRSHSPIAAYESTMHAHYISGLLLPPFDLLRRTGARVHQALSDRRTYAFLWSLFPPIRSDALFHRALYLSDRALVNVPNTLTNRPPRPLALPARNGLSPYVHRYPAWIGGALVDVMDEMLARDWFDATGIFDGGAVRRVWQDVRSDPGALRQAAYLLTWLCSLRYVVEGSRPVPAKGTPDRYAREANPDEAVGTAQEHPRPRPPWGFVGRDRDPAWRRVLSAPRQAVNIARGGW